MNIAKSMKGSTGAVKDIVHVKGSNLTFSCGYDRFLRVFDYKTNEDLPQIYLKHKLNVVFPYDVQVEDESDDEENSKDSKGDLEDEELFEEGEDEEVENDDGAEADQEGEDFDDDDGFEVIDEEDVDSIDSDEDEEEIVIKSKKTVKKNKK